jgi:hypothetical protein
MMDQRFHSRLLSACEEGRSPNFPDISREEPAGISRSGPAIRANPYPKINPLSSTRISQGMENKFRKTGSADLGVNESRY